MRDQNVLTHVAPTANKLAQQYPNTIEPLIDRWVGSKEDYVNA